MACKLVVIGIFFLGFLVFCNVRVNGRNMTISKEEDIEIKRKLKILNKPPIKTLQIDGITFDCIDIHKQPALDHPLLINHTIQMWPSSLPVEKNPVSTSSTELFGSTFRRKGCPPGTVIIRRTKKENLINSKLFSTFTTDPTASSSASSDEHYAYYLTFDRSNFYGLRGNPTVHGLPGMPKGHTSSVFATLTNGKGENFISLQAGWSVSPPIYGDDRTHFTIKWTIGGNNKEGCANLLCPGFVQVGRYFPPGSAFKQSELSVYNGKQNVFRISISKDKQTGNWWLMVGSTLTPVGYWPNSLVKGLANGADTMTMGGFASAPENEPSPPMGSGHYITEGWRKASRFESMQYLNENNEYQTPKNDNLMVDVPACYDVGKPFDDKIGKTLYFGGPGGDCSWKCC